MNEPSGWKKHFWFLRSRKVQVAVATAVAAFLVDHGMNVGQETIVAIVGVGVALILGISHEDNGRNRQVQLIGEELRVETQEAPNGNGQAKT